MAMQQEACIESLRKHIVATSPVHEKPLQFLLELFEEVRLPANSFLSGAGEFPGHFAFICEGMMLSGYTNMRGKQYVKDFYKTHEFVMPMPSFIYRKPSFVEFQAITPCKVLQAKYTDFENLAQRHSSVKDFLRALVDREWIIRKSNNEASEYIYNLQSRYRLLAERLGGTLVKIPDELLASFFQISVNQLQKLKSSYKPQR